MICLNIAVSAGALIDSPSRTATVRAVSFSWPPVMMPSGSGTMRAVVEEDVDVILGRQQGADVALQHEVRTVGVLDRFSDLWVGGVDQIADLAADRLLPIGEGLDVGVNSWVCGVGHG